MQKDHVMEYNTLINNSIVLFISANVYPFALLLILHMAAGGLEPIPRDSQHGVPTHSKLQSHTLNRTLYTILEMPIYKHKSLAPRGKLRGMGRT